MPKVNLSRMNVEALMDLRKRVEARLVEHRAQLEKELERMGRAVADTPRICRFFPSQQSVSKRSARCDMSAG
jgi:hypothetical protein